MPKRKLDVTWNGFELDHYPNPIYLGVTLDRKLSFKQHAFNTKAKVNTRNNLLWKLTNSRWGAHPATARTTALALCFSTAEYACSPWGRSRHTGHVDIALNDTCRIITGCLKATPIPCLYALAGIATPHIRRKVAANADRCLQEDDPRYPLHGSSQMNIWPAAQTRPGPLGGAWIGWECRKDVVGLWWKCGCSPIQMYVTVGRDRLCLILWHVVMPPIARGQTWLFQPCRCQLCQTLGWINLTVDIEDSSKKNRQPLCPVVGRRHQHAVSKLPCIVLSSAIIVSLQYLSRSYLHRLAGIPCRLFLSYGLCTLVMQYHTT